jgi:antitoxin YefM
MNAISYTVARENLASTMDQVCQDHNPVIITRGRKDAVVMMSLEDYSSWEETAYLMRSPANAMRLLESIEEIKQGKGIKKKLSDLVE